MVEIRSVSVETFLLNKTGTNVAWRNVTGPLVNIQGWFQKLAMASTLLSLGGGEVGGEKLKLMLTQSSCAGTGTELGKKNEKLGW